jgi:hypothetical protein
MFHLNRPSSSPKELCWVSTQNSKLKTQNSNQTPTRQSELGRLLVRLLLQNPVLQNGVD